MEVRNQSEIKGDLDSTLTPIRYDDLHRGESYARQQHDFVPRSQPFSSNSQQDDHHKPRFQPSRPSLSAFHTYSDGPCPEEQHSIEPHSYDNADGRDEDLTVEYADSLEYPPDYISREHPDLHDPSLSAI